MEEVDPSCNPVQPLLEVIYNKLRIYNIDFNGDEKKYLVKVFYSC